MLPIFNIGCVRAILLCGPAGRPISVSPHISSLTPRDIIGLLFVLCERHLRHGLLRQIFRSWRARQPEASSFSSWIRDCDHAIAWHRWAFDDLAPRFVQADSSHER